MAASMLYGFHALRKTSVLTLTKCHFGSGSGKSTTITDEGINNSANESSVREMTESVSMVYGESLPGEKALHGFARAMGKISEERVRINTGEHQELDMQDETFASILRKSKLMQIGDPSSRVVAATIMETVGDDLYIDFGCKFHCVCEKAKLTPERYHRGVSVKLQVRDLEMTSAFLGSDKHITLQEADSVLKGLRRTDADTTLY
ncbi:28S ribosomal protein S28, mitochondrial-like [Haliotis rubra]|uniref:28S ribosomal protein S28, mitochondrial-like n=1 Tax=Haliotis rubra TaxID=36100 RepID=UPI001EE54AA2|nr:28S ribosomal protein S28, mitochondrial-like [Haliotis rubra]